MASPERSSPAYYIAISLLAAGLIGLVLLLTLLVSRPSTGQQPSFDVATPVAAECPVGSGAPACYRVDIRNTGDMDLTLTCILRSGPDTEATFQDGGSDVVDVSVLSQLTQSVFIRVLPQDSVVAAPAISCSP
jgi:hypothetical protein